MEESLKDDSTSIPSNGRTAKRPSLRFAAFAATAAAGLVAFHAMYVRLGEIVFGVAEEDMTFAALVPFFSLYLLWSDRKEIAKAAGAPSIWGTLATLPLLFISLVGSRGEQLRLEQLGFIALVVTLPWAFYGWRLARRILFPAAYLLFTIPLASFLDVITVHLRLFAVSAAVAILNGLGFEAVQQGTALSAGGTMPFSIDVAEPCSGLRSLFALSALTAAYARLYQPTWLRRLALFAFAAPLAVAGNIARVVSICLASAVFGGEFGTGFYHDYSGYIVFIVAIALMLCVNSAIDKICGRAKPATPGEAAPPLPAPAGKCPAAVLAFAALAIAAFVHQARTPAPEYLPDMTCTLPAAMPGFASDDLLFCQNERCMAYFPASTVGKPTACPKCGGVLSHMALGEHTILPADTRIAKKIYATPAGEKFIVSMVYGGRTRASLHRPELCLPSQGNLMRSKRNFTGAKNPFHVIEFTGRGGESTSLAYTFFNQDGVRTASHTARIFRDAWDRSIHNRIDRWVMVTVSQSPAHAASLERFLKQLSETLP